MGTHDDLTPEQFDAAFQKGEPVEVTGSPRVIVQDLEVMPGVSPSSRPDLTYGTTVKVPVSLGADYSPRLPGSRSAAAATA